MAELLMVLIPLLLLFLCILELARFSIASLMLHRSAGIAARACAVIKNQPLHCDNNLDDRTGQDPGQDAAIQAAAVAAIKPLEPQQLQVDGVRCSVGSDPTPESGTDQVSVTARYSCVFPLARDILCGAGAGGEAGGRSRGMLANAKFAHQGARYDCWYSKEVRWGIPGVGATAAVMNPENF